LESDGQESGVTALPSRATLTRPKHVWSIRTKLQIEGRVRDLAMFNLAIDSKLRGCDVVAIKVEDVAAGGYTADRATVRQKKTGQPVRFELSEQTRQAVDDYLLAANKSPASSCSRVIVVPSTA
jgi:integrase